MTVQPSAQELRSSPRPSDLPEYERPPLVEVVLSVQFAPLPGITIAHLGLLWGRFRDQFPQVEEHAPLPRVYEALDSPRALEARVSFEVADRPPSPRLWFVKGEGSELIQVQADRFIHNWRKTGSGDAYPRYERVKERFREELAQFEAFVIRESLGDFVLDLAEITYVNHIVAGQGWAAHQEMDKVFTQWSPLVGTGELEDARISARFLLRDGTGEPFGRLYLDVKPGRRREDGTAIFVFELTARGDAMGSPTADGALTFMDAGREAIVRAFTAATTSEMHEVWGRAR